MRLNSMVYIRSATLLQKLISDLAVLERCAALTARAGKVYAEFLFDLSKSERTAFRIKLDTLSPFIESREA